ncbi:MAG: shikimate kinase [Succiniclasticum sp.]|uniref:shikimate kinase n=1 Tax=Succiniclasticum sp. TaxID=2775030 RepID=UPI002A919F5C|nr:shikimate kinase [Succiniclasticum sp.]MBR1495275.1 shikimate kinase [Acidaminococcaceae bacterium]MBR1662604.1 shikimate kinase [Acidaminococcaceae bacterium]MDY6291486.1 shikimate kinase [Succiniclasticum sp.]
MRNIVLIGMPGCGKSTLGRYLAEILDRDFIDADPEIEKDAGKTIPELFAVSEDCFREQETKTVKRLAGLQGKVLAMGGGVVLRRENIENLKKNGTIIFLDRSPGDIAGDVDTETRPLLAAGRKRIYDLYAQREALYREAADVTVRNKGTLKETLQRLVEAAKQAGG